MPPSQAWSWSLRERAGEDEAEPHPHLGAAEVGLGGVGGAAGGLVPARGVGEGVGQPQLEPGGGLGEALAPVGLVLDAVEVEQNPAGRLLREHRQQGRAQERVVDLGLALRLLDLLRQHARPVAGVVHVRELRVREAEDGLAVGGEPAPGRGPDDAAVAVALQLGQLGEEVARPVALDRLVVEPRRLLGAELAAVGGEELDQPLAPDGAQDGEAERRPRPGDITRAGSLPALRPCPAPLRRGTSVVSGGAEASMPEPAGAELRSGVRGCYRRHLGRGRPLRRPPLLALVHAGDAPCRARPAARWRPAFFRSAKQAGHVRSPLPSRTPPRRACGTGHRREPASAARRTPKHESPAPLRVQAGRNRWHRRSAVAAALDWPSGQERCVASCVRG